MDEKNNLTQSKCSYLSTNPINEIAFFFKLGVHLGGYYTCL